VGLPPLALYIHWPFCAKKCPYCDYNSYAIGWHSEEAALWAKAYIRALETLVRDYPQHRLDTVFFGGGTPSQMPLSVLESLLSAIYDVFPARADAVEMTLEANPRDISKGLLQSYYDLGINRISLGVQSFDDDELMFLGRDHNAKVARDALDAVTTVFDRYSIDLMYGLPHHTTALWQGRLEEALSLGTRHLSLYQLTIEPETGFYRPFQRGDYKLPENSVLADLFNITHELCADRGLVGYEISSFAVSGQECRHNLHYWHYNSYFGIGPGSHGRVHHNGQTHALASMKNPAAWREGILNERIGVVEKIPLTPSEAALERLYMGLRLREGLNRSVFQDLQNGGHIDLAAYQALCAQGLMAEGRETVFLTEKGRLRLDGVVVDLLKA
jgi:putative oxygen-independent coproporphyrinogen III oxidase